MTYYRSIGDYNRSSSAGVREASSRWLFVVALKMSDDESDRKSEHAKVSVKRIPVFFHVKGSTAETIEVEKTKRVFLLPWISQDTVTSETPSSIYYKYVSTDKLIVEQNGTLKLKNSTVFNLAAVNKQRYFARNHALNTALAALVVQRSAWPVDEDNEFLDPIEKRVYIISRLLRLGLNHYGKTRKGGRRSK